MLSRGIFETRGAKLIAVMAVALLISLMLGFGLSTTALGATDFDGDGVAMATASHTIRWSPPASRTSRTCSLRTRTATA